MSCVFLSLFRKTESIHFKKMLEVSVFFWTIFSNLTKMFLLSLIRNIVSSLHSNFCYCVVLSTAMIVCKTKMYPVDKIH